ncbi:hypothetical protein DFP74_1365 [Nocardiopsis sp. Huas11]|uniref:DUF2087 domain-containing protein n=1 Tax=Nocardiopsis sp. Huas11 TaxID=2183912 RepID=UPI000EAD4288|nr:DUF2087 domain-containing protein [Nocardiopsis sp. Huas11]RKS05754.1 hypothetical protein DFP74_1365 [Nocardiopsis sp. Huas11]
MPHPAQLTSSLADPDRLALYARVVCSGGAGLPAEEVRSAGAKAAKRLARLLRDGLVREDGDRVVAVPEVFGEATASARPRSADPVDAVFRAGRLAELPARRELRLAVFARVTERLFAPGLEYTEKQVNTAIRTCYDDPSALRRHLVEEGFLAREDDGSRYRVTPS